MSKVKIMDKKCEKSIKAEREFLAKLHHPFIVNMNCAFQDYENLYLVMDLLTGGDLRYHFCRIRRFTEEETKFFIACLLLGLEYIHNNNIIHRDIKPENLVCDQNGYIRITDFGIAKINKSDNSSETSGTPGYMAPEVLLAKNYTFTVDFFAIGVIGHEFMLGKRPYHGNNKKQIKQLMIKTQVRIDIDKVDWSEESVDFINRCLKRKESKRLGYTDGIKELKEHKWFEGFDWDKVYHKKIEAPFIPKKEGNYDKSYCEIEEKCGQETKTRYDSYTSRKNYDNLFLGYTYINLDLINDSCEDTYTKRQENSKQDYTTNKKERIKNNNMIIKAFLNKNKNLFKKKKRSSNNNIIINNYNNVNLNVNSLIMNKNYFGDVSKKLMDKSEKNIKKENRNQLKEQGLDLKMNYSNNNLIAGKMSNNKIKRENFINEDIHNISDRKIKKKKGLIKSPSILSLICSPQNGTKFKLEKNNSFLHLKGEVNLFSYNNIQNNNYNLNDTNLSNLLSSNSILNLNSMFKVGHLKNFKDNKDKIIMRNSSIEHKSLSFNKIDTSKCHKNKRTNKIIEANYKKHINKLSHKNKKDGSLTGRHSLLLPKRNNSCLKLKFKTKKIDNTFSLNSTLLSPLNKNDESNKSKIINFHSASNRRIKINKSKNYIQLRQINKNPLKNKLLFYFPNWNNIHGKKQLNMFNLEEFKEKGKIEMENRKLNMMKNNSKIGEKLDQMKHKQESFKMKRSISSLLFNKEVKLERKINLFINKNKVNEPITKKTNSTNAENNIRKRLVRNASDVF